jgi:hypothetical protein
MNKNTKYGILLVGAVSLIMFSAIALSGSQDNIKPVNNPSQDNTKLVNNDQDTCLVSASVIGLNHDELSNRSDTIVMGTVKERLPSKWNSIDGKKPGATTKFSPYNLIYTDIIISVDKYLKNPLSSKEVRVRVAGGTVGNDTLTMQDEPSFKTGEKVLLYLMKDDSPGTKDIGPDHFVVTGLLQGKFTLTDDGKAVRPDETVSQDELLSTIKQ